MPAYFVYVCQQVLDRAKLEAYWREIILTLEGYEAKHYFGRFFAARDSQISFSVTHGRSARGGADHGGRDIGLEGRA